MAEVAEPLVVEPLVAVALEQRPNGGDEPIAWNQIGIQRPQPRAEHTAAYEQAVLVQRTTDEREVGGVGSRAAVGAPGHPDRERRIRNTQSLELGLELRDHVRMRPFSTNTPRKERPLPCSCHPRWSSISDTWTGAAGASGRPSWRSTCSRNQSSPCLSSRYLSRACRRSLRLP